MKDINDEDIYWYITRPPNEPSKSMWHHTREHAERHIKSTVPDHELVICVAPPETVLRLGFVEEKNEYR